MSSFLSRKREPMTLKEWAVAYENADNRQVALDENVVPGVTVSTIWEGIVTPLRGIFESVAIVDGEIHWDTAIHSDTEEEAYAAHAKLVDRAKNGGYPWVRKTSS